MTVKAKYLPLLFVDAAPTLAGALRRVIVLLLAVTCLAVSEKARGQLEMTDEEYALLPEYCRYKPWVSTRHLNPPRSEKWEAYFGKDWLPVHHYCWAIVRLARAYRAGATAAERKYYLEGADGGVEFVLQNSSSQTPIRAELYTKQVEVRTMQRNDRGAERAFRYAVEADPKYWKAYSVWGFYLFQSGRNQQALRVVEEGLKNVPGNPRLERLAAEIRAGGKQTQRK
jgi:tetratricopeptide (TPR) repeat protein